MQGVNSRSHTAVCGEDTVIYTIKQQYLQEQLQGYENIEKLMNKIAKEKSNYHKLLDYEVKMKYNRKTKIEMLFNEKKDDDWTFYMSTKRATIKKKIDSR